MADILTLSEYRSLKGLKPSDTKNDAKITALLPAAQQAILTYTERDFSTSPITETRQFSYDGSGYVDIDDAATITSVTLMVPNTSNYVFSSDEYVPLPRRRDDAPVYWYLALGGATLGSPEMGFTYNLDVYAAERGWPPVGSTIEVDGTWGWPTVPADVKLAATWIIDEWLMRDTGEGLTSEAIESYSRSWGGRASGDMVALAIPNRARDLLAGYAKVNL